MTGKNSHVHVERQGVKSVHLGRNFEEVGPAYPEELPFGPWSLMSL